MARDYNKYFSVLKKRIIEYRSIIAILTTIIYISIMITAILVSDCSSVKVIIMIVFAIWTIAVPCWFFIEYVCNIDQSDFKEKVSKLKDLQDSARAIWAACAVVGFLLLKAKGISP